MTQRYQRIVRNRLLASVALSALMCGSALADPMDFTWTGPYVGGNLGYIGGRTEAHDIDGSGFGGGKASSGGVLGGAQIGYNWQFGPIVLGAESDVDFSSLNTSATGGAFPFIPVSYRSQISDLGTARGRLGYAFAPMPILLYATAGVAVGQVKNTVGLPTFPPGDTGSTSNWRTGWTVGAGVEYAFAKSWTVRAEGLFVDLGSEHVATGLNNYRFGFRDQAAIGRTAINFKF